MVRRRKVQVEKILSCRYMSLLTILVSVDAASSPIVNGKALTSTVSSTD